MFKPTFNGEHTRLLSTRVAKSYKPSMMFAVFGTMATARSERFERSESETFHLWGNSVKQDLTEYIPSFTSGMLAEANVFQLRNILTFVGYILVSGKTS